MPLLMETTYEVLTEIIQLLESQIPANPQSPKNQGLEKRLEQELRKYFQSLDNAFPYSKLAGLYNKYVEKE